MAEDTALKAEELQNAYRSAKSTFLQLHRAMIRLKLVSDRERIAIYDLTKNSS